MNIPLSEIRESEERNSSNREFLCFYDETFGFIFAIFYFILHQEECRISDGVSCESEGYPPPPQDKSCSLRNVSHIFIEAQFQKTIKTMCTTHNE